jgi:peptidoglycan/xylan/chitin deacetylase (PgdA/CDA1 family)
MTATPLITTSWDDGHPLDQRVAEMLLRHNLRGTFYVPRNGPAGTMSAGQIRELGEAFELGAHTLEHVDLTAVSDHRAGHEIAQSRAWLEDISGKPCVMFCPPRGRYARRHLAMIRKAGFLGLRTVELVSLDRPRRDAGLLVMPTTVQAHPHRRGPFFRNFARRAAARNLWLYLLHARSNNWHDLVRSLLQSALRRGGVFHLWGHSWEVEATGQWDRLEEVLRYLGGFAGAAIAATNAEVCLRSRAASAPLH